VGINAALGVQIYKLHKVKRSEGHSLFSWSNYAFWTGALAVFAIAKDQHWTLILNYIIITVLQGTISVQVYLGRNKGKRG